MAGYQEERGRFVESMRQEGMGEHTARLIMRHANTIQRLAAIACSVERSERQERADDKKESQCEARIVALCKPLKITPDFQGDPRGACVKLRVPSGRTDDWGQTGICVPTREF